MELLAPVGNRESLECAIYNGADAVYLGLSNFNARIKADNFNFDNIADVVRFAHTYGVKVYLTVNTLVADDEVEDFIKTIKVAVGAKVDAFIIQDFGMAMLLKKHFQGIVLHASTQMGIHNLQGAKLLEQMGFARVVLARETKLEDIRQIRDNTNLEIEYFVQGALCVAFSGNCYLSSLKNGNSGNRGKCLQLCRLPYKIFKEDKQIGEGFYLSPKDLSLIGRLNELKDAGVTSIKIEGRLKRASYVAQTVRSYRKVLAFEGVDIEKEKHKMQEVFSRGEFNDSAYLTDNFDIINPKLNNHEGKKIGKVTKVEDFKDIHRVTLKLSEAIGENDAIRLIGNNKTVSIGVGNVNRLQNEIYEIFTKYMPEVNSDVYLLKSTAKEAILTQYVRKLHIDLTLTAKVNSKIKLEAKFANIQVEVESDDVVSKARTKACTYEDCYRSLSRLNDTNFVLQMLNVELDEVFIPVSILNDLRRRVAEELQNEIIKIYELSMPQVKICDIDTTAPQVKTPKEDFVIIDDVVQLTKGINYDIIISPKDYAPQNVKIMVDKLLQRGFTKEHIYLDLPIVSTGKELEVLTELLDCIKTGIIINNYSHVNLAKKYRSIAGTSMNVYNMFTAKTLLDLGVHNFIYSLELKKYQPCGIVYAKGRPALMTLCHCPIRVALGGDCNNCKYTDNLKYVDEKGNEYKLRRKKQIHCYFDLYSADEIYVRSSIYGKIIDLRSDAI